MSRKTTENAPTSGKSTREGPMTPARIVVAVLGVLALIFIFENTRSTRIRLIVPEVTMPLWVALLATALIGALCGAYAMRRRR
ncbi:LapA family protein [Streptomyces sp. NPDC060011]|uniref:LapA family protein n=1 Tax=unclassified Streptomyces TaxID=2593676 RepID=UPI0013B88E01|nr:MULTISPECIES: LapA family protein [unclassified Streptomyces]MCX4917947.1 LapA family protein [Streptomyces sp. NBC_00687]MCX5280025.1 LapA family protein [Streptomyces sp. NBC_00198]NEB33393.1 LapA family protein [Streptomyces sp. SID14446]WSK60270.1 LapA family protein [Streptomyces sp. NBC_01281]